MTVHHPLPDESGPTGQRTKAGAVLGGITHWVGLLPRRLLVAPVRFYQIAISPLFGPSCRYYPCCSSYTVTALRRHGAVRGLVLSGWRILRCNPWNAGGVDHVPPAGIPLSRALRRSRDTKKAFAGTVPALPGTRSQS